MSTNHRSSQPSERGSFPEISGLIIAASQHLILVVALAGLLAGGLAVAATMLVKEEFLATSFVQVRQREDFLLFNEQSRAEDAAVVRAQQELVLQQQNLTKALESDEVKQISSQLPSRARAEWLRGLLKVDQQPGAEVLSITAVHESPEVSQILANAVTKSYLDQVSDKATEERDRRRNELQRAASVVDQRLASQWDKLQRLAGDLGTGSPQTLSIREQIQMQGYREYAQQLRAAQLSRNQLETELAEEQLRQSSDFRVSEVILQAEIAKHPEVVLQRGRLEFIEAKLHEISELVPNQESPRIKSLREDRDFYSAQLEKLVEDLKPRLRQQMGETEAASRATLLAQLEKQISLKRDEETFLRDMLSQLEGNIEEVGGGNGVQLEMLRHEIDRQEQLADNIWHSLEKIKIEEQARPRIALIEWAALPDKANRARQMKAAATAAVAGVFLAVFGVGYFEWRTCRIRHPKDVATYTSLAVFGTGSFTDGLPLLWRLKNARHDPLRSGVNEVAAQLMLQAQGSTALPSILVTSATQLEPRHIVAAELAQALAQTGRRVLLVDCDPTRPELSRRLGAHKQSGLCDWKSAASDLMGEVLVTSQDGLEFLPVGTTNESSVLLAARALPHLLQQAVRRYDSVVVCGPAVLTTAESVLIASQTDNSVFTFVMGKSRWNLLAAAHHRLDYARVSVLGAVIHNARRLKSLKSADRAHSHRPRESRSDSGELEQQLQNTIQELHTEMDSIQSPANQTTTAPPRPAAPVSGPKPPTEDGRLS